MSYQLYLKKVYGGHFGAVLIIPSVQEEEKKPPLNEVEKQITRKWPESEHKMFKKRNSAMYLQPWTDSKGNPLVGGTIDVGYRLSVYL